MPTIKVGIIESASDDTAPPVGTGDYYISEDGNDRFITEQGDNLVQE